MQKTAWVQMVLGNEASIFTLFYLLIWFCCPGWDSQRNTSFVSEMHWDLNLSNWTVAWYFVLTMITYFLLRSSKVKNKSEIYKIGLYKVLQKTHRNPTTFHKKRKISIVPPQSNILKMLSLLHSEFSQIFSLH